MITGPREHSILTGVIGSWPGSLLVDTLVVFMYKRDFLKRRISRRQQKLGNLWCRFVVVVVVECVYISMPLPFFHLHDKGRLSKGYTAVKFSYAAI